MFRKKIWFVLLFLSVVLSALTSCGQADPEAVYKTYSSGILDAEGFDQWASELSDEDKENVVSCVKIVNAAIYAGGADGMPQCDSIAEEYREECNKLSFSVLGATLSSMETVVTDGQSWANTQFGGPAIFGKRSAPEEYMKTHEAILQLIRPKLMCN